MNSDYFKVADQLRASGESFVLVTLVDEKGHVPQDIGAKAIITGKGLYFGTIGGGKVEAKAIKHAQDLLDQPTFHDAPKPLQQWNLQTDVGMTCGGTVSFFFEVHQQRQWQIIIFGAGHVAQALVRTLLALECQVVCIDSRAEWINRLPDHARLTKAISENPASLVERFGEQSFFLSMTQGHATDLPILLAIYAKFPNPLYVGAIGSVVKARRLKSDLQTAGIAIEQIENLRCPIGLKLGNNHPAEIAISISAELLQRRDELMPQGAGKNL